MEFNPTVLKVEFSQLNYRIWKLHQKLEWCDPDDPDFERASNMLESMCNYRNSLRYFCKKNNVDLGGK